jgi:hypothetical protein
MKTIKELERLEKLLKKSPLPKAKKEWYGADVHITKRSIDDRNERRFYSNPRSVKTPYALELSWFFENLRDAFYAEKRLDDLSKIEFFGRLANAAIRCIKENPNVSANLLCAVVLHEAFIIFDEMEKNIFLETTIPCFSFDTESINLRLRYDECRMIC